MRIRISERVTLAAVALIVLTTATSCAGLGALLGGSPKPKVQLDKASLKTATVKQIELGVDFTVENPYSVSLPALGFDYQVWIAGVELAHGTVRFDKPIPAHGKAPLSTTLGFGPVDAAKVMARLALGSRRYRVTGTFRVRTPAGELGVRVSHSGKLSGGTLLERLGLPGVSQTRPQVRPDA